MRPGATLETESGDPFRILIVDDNPINRAVAAGILRKTGHITEFAENGSVAVARYRDHHFDFILMDLQMPVFDGLSATAAIRALEKGRSQRVPIVAMTAHAMKGDRERCLQAGIDGYIAKPVKKQELVELLREHVSHSSEEGGGAVGGREKTVTFDDELLARFDGDAELLQRVSRIFIEQTPPMMETLRRAVATRNATVLKQTAHKLIGSLGTFGAETAVDCARELEDLAGDNAFAPAEEVVTKLGNEVNWLQSRLSSVA